MRKLLLCAFVLVAACSTKRDKVIANNEMKDAQECRSKGGIMLQAQYNGPLTCVKLGEAIPLIGPREVPPVE